MRSLSHRTIILFLLTLLFLAGLFFAFINFPRIQKFYENQKLQAHTSERERPYREDTYGGRTPEETYQLFVGALKEGSIERAARYFIVNKQNEWKGNLKKIKETGDLSSMITDLEKIKPRGFLSQDTFQFDLINENSEVVLLVTLVKNKYTDKWKIESM